MKTIKLLTSDGVTREIDVVWAKMCKTLKDMLESTANEESVDQTAIPLCDITSKTLDKVIEWISYHISDPESDSDSEQENELRTDNISQWDQKFIDVNRDTLFDIILAANYLDIKGLLELGTKTAANQIKAKTAEEVRELWAIECDYSKEEEEIIKKQNEWAEHN